MQSRRLDLWFIQPLQRVHSSIEARIRNGKLDRLVAVGLSQLASPLSCRALQNRPRRLQSSSDEARHGTALAEAAHCINAASLTDSLGDDGHALVEEAVRVGAVVLAEPAPGVGEVCRIGDGVAALGFGGGRRVDEAWDVLGEKAVWARGVEEDWEEGDGGEGLGEEFLEGAGFGAEERAGLCVAFWNS